jgi:hypothetical protein
VAKEQEAQHGPKIRPIARLSRLSLAGSFRLDRGFVIPAAAHFDGRHTLHSEIRRNDVILAKSGAIRCDPTPELIDLGRFLPNVSAHGTYPFDSRAFAYGTTLTGLHPICAGYFKKSAVCEKYRHIFACRFEQQMVAELCR